ncbi:hypothetical protein [[Phormidium] sp. ETS-05]|uniref:hypothetical protein n=1 Tax=[Phormidium] sp. ETS-05 TaxID=222819 RepID=UPI0018EEDD77|nr:hypothetical protein [[Phormidium] sp. ETS-05]
MSVSVGCSVGANGHSPLQNTGYQKNSADGTAHPTIALLQDLRLNSTGRVGKILPTLHILYSDATG